MIEKNRKKMLFVFNPNSGKAQIKNYLIQILQTFSSAGYEVTVYPTKAPMDGHNYIESVENQYDCIVCSGGDGTLNETVDAVMKFKNQVPIGYIPSGTTNDFATSLSIPNNMAKAAERIIVGKPTEIDIGRFNGRGFNYVAGFGAFTDVSYATPQNMKNILGHQAYILEGVKRIASLKSYKMRIEYEGGSIQDEFIFGAITNSKSMGGMKGITGKNIKLNDGLFEVLMIKTPRNPLELQQVVTALISQHISDISMAYSFKASKLSIVSEDAIAWVLDGEYGGECRHVNIDVVHNAVKIIINKSI